MTKTQKFSLILSYYIILLKYDVLWFFLSKILLSDFLYYWVGNIIFRPLEGNKKRCKHFALQKTVSDNLSTKNIFEHVFLHNFSSIQLVKNYKSVDTWKSIMRGHKFCYFSLNKNSDGADTVHRIHKNC